MIRPAIAFWLLSLTTLSYALTAEATPPSGTYDRVIRFTIRTDEPTARIVYTFEPDGTPDDALTYSGATWVGSDSRILFFAYTDEQNATKILEREYRFRYPPLTLEWGDSMPYDASDIRFVLVNSLGKEVSLDSWQIRTSDGETLYLAGVLSPWEKRSISVRFSWKALTVDLISPDEKVKDSRVFTRQNAPVRVTVIPASAPAESITDGRLPEDVSEPSEEVVVPAQEIMPSSPSADEVSSGAETAPIETLPSPSIEAPQQQAPEIRLQSSALEGTSSTLPIVSLLALIFLAAGAFVWKKYQ